MVDRRWARVKKLFEQAARLSAGDRSRLLDRECAGDPELRDEIESLLRHDAGTQTEIDEGSPLAVVRQTSLSVPTATEQIGAYRLIELIGEGGMGQVWRAEQLEPVQRFVAVKIVRSGLDSHEVIRRFDGERQALARMDHPNVARFHDAGETPQGLPYFVMELVDGETIVRYCERRSLSLPDRLRLFVEVCSGVQHAHHKALIHRDLKPSNILVTEVDGEPVPKIIDFGIAKATEVGLTGRTIHTRLGQAIGTPEYMSPEQAAGDVDVDARSDVFSLGVVLYQLLTGTLPLEGDGPSPLSPLEFLDRMRTTDPDRPSLRVDEPEARRAIRGELDWICMCALEKDRERRYQSPGDLREDVRRHLTGEAVSASPPSNWYRLRKTVQRHRSVVGAIAATFVVLVVSVIVSTGFGLREAEQRREAVRAQEDLQATVDFLSGMLSEMDTEGVGYRLMEDLLERVREIRRERGENEEEVEAGATSLAKAIEGVNTTNVALRIVDEEILARALGTLEERFTDRPLIDARLRETIGVTYDRLGLYPQAEAAFEVAAESHRRLLGAEHPLTLDSLNRLANLYLRLGRYSEGEKLHSEILEARRRIFGDEHRTTFISLDNVARAYARQGQYAEAERCYLERIETQEPLLGVDHPELFWTRINLASVYESQGRYVEAERLNRETLDMHRARLGPEHPDLLMAMNNLAIVYSSQDRLDEAESLHREIVFARRSVLGDDHPDTLDSMQSLAAVYHRQGRVGEAERIYLEALSGQRRVLGADHPDTVMCLYDLACLALLRGDRPRAAEWLSEARAVGGTLELNDLDMKCPDPALP